MSVAGLRMPVDGADLRNKIAQIYYVHVRSVVTKARCTIHVNPVLCMLDAVHSPSLHNIVNIVSALAYPSLWYRY